MHLRENNNLHFIKFRILTHLSNKSSKEIWEQKKIFFLIIEFLLRTSYVEIV